MFTSIHTTARKAAVTLSRLLGLPLGLLLTSLAAHADWQLVNEASQLNFISTKATHIAEIHGFTRLTGNISGTGVAELNIDLSSIDTGIEIRNTRMQSMLFDVVNFPQAQIRTELDLAALQSLEGPRRLPISAALGLAGQSAEVTGEVLIVPIDADTVSVTTVQPIVVNANALDLAAGIERLREVAGLPSIGYSVPVTFSLTFNR